MGVLLERASYPNSRIKVRSASDVATEGYVTVNGDGELTGTVIGSKQVTAGGNIEIMGADLNRTSLLIRNRSANNLWISSTDKSTILTDGFCILPNQSEEIDSPTSTLYGRSQGIGIPNRINVEFQQGVG